MKVKNIMSDRFTGKISVKVRDFAFEQFVYIISAWLQKPKDCLVF